MSTTTSEEAKARVEAQQAAAATQAAHAHTRAMADAAALVAVGGHLSSQPNVYPPSYSGAEHNGVSPSTTPTGGDGSGTVTPDGSANILAGFVAPVPDPKTGRLDPNDPAVRACGYFAAEDGQDAEFLL